MFLQKALILLGLLALCYAQCTNENCALPNCRCFGDDAIPGGLSREETPQIVLITGDYQLNSEYDEDDQKLFTVRNPNDCPITGTFYVQDAGTDFSIVKKYYDAKFEIGIQSDNGQIPTDQKGWDDMITKVRSDIIAAGVPEEDIRGYRAPELTPGGLNEYVAIGNGKMIYASDCTTSDFTRWPYTLDYPDADNICNVGSLPTQEFPGKWQVPVHTLTFQGQTCTTPRACTNVVTKKDAFDILYDNFIQHYEGNRAPFVVVIDAAWLKNTDALDGTVEFVEYVRAAFDDTWIINEWQALQWVQEPTPISNLTDFAPWQCS